MKKEVMGLKDFHPGMCIYFCFWERDWCSYRFYLFIYLKCGDFRIM